MVVQLTLIIMFYNNFYSIIIRSVFKNDCYYYPQIYLDSCSLNYKNE